MAIEFRELTVPYIHGYNYAVGADVLSGNPKSTAVRGEKSPVGEAEGPVVSASIRRIQSTIELERALGVDAKATYGAASFGLGVSARFTFAREAKVQTSSLFLALLVQVDLAFESITEPKLSAEAKRHAADARQFAQLYGNSFIRGIARGGLFVGLLQIDSWDRDHANRIAGDLVGGIQLGSAEARAKFDKAASEAESDIELKVYYEGGPADLDVTGLTDPLRLLDSAQRFQTELQTNPSSARPYSVTLAPYTIVPDAPARQKGTDVEGALGVLRACGEHRSVLLDTLNSLEFICANEARFDISNGSSFAAVRQAVREVRDAADLVSDCAEHAIKHPARANPPERYAELKGKDFPGYQVPDPLPFAKPRPQLVAVPDFSRCRNWDECLDIGAELYLIRETPSAGSVENDFRVIGQSPTAGVSVPGLSGVKVVTAPVKGPPEKVSRWDAFRNAPIRLVRRLPGLRKRRR